MERRHPWRRKRQGISKNFSKKHLKQLENEDRINVTLEE
jgi:hypothetical protein